MSGLALGVFALKLGSVLWMLPYCHLSVLCGWEKSLLGYLKSQSLPIWTQILSVSYVVKFWPERGAEVFRQ